MAIGKVSVYAAVIASGASTSAEVDFGRGYAKVIYDCTGAAGASQFFAAATTGGTFRPVNYPVLSGMSTPQTCTVGSGMSGALVEVTPLAGLRFVKVAATGTIANGMTLYFYGSDI